MSGRVELRFVRLQLVVVWLVEWLDGSGMTAKRRGKGKQRGSPSVRPISPAASVELDDRCSPILCSATRLLERTSEQRCADVQPAAVGWQRIEWLESMSGMWWAVGSVGVRVDRRLRLGSQPTAQSAVTAPTASPRRPSVAHSTRADVRVVASRWTTVSEVRAAMPPL